MDGIVLGLFLRRPLRRLAFWLLLACTFGGPAVTGALAAITCKPILSVRNIRGNSCFRYVGPTVDLESDDRCRQRLLRDGRRFDTDSNSLGLDVRLANDAVVFFIFLAHQRRELGSALFLRNKVAYQY